MAIDVLRPDPHPFLLKNRRPSSGLQQPHHQPAKLQAPQHKTIMPDEDRGMHLLAQTAVTWNLLGDACVFGRVGGEFRLLVRAE